MIAVFSGPTLSHDEILQHIDCICLPPVRQGDVLKLLSDKPQVIGIVDGYFEGAPSVWHKEILYAINQGVRVFGSSSMGALRAAELHAFGMVGVGQIFEWYRDGVIEDDDEVAVLHGPQDVGYIVASEPMVNIRASLNHARALDVIDDAQHGLLLHKAKSRFYKQRSWKQLFADCAELFDDGCLPESISPWLLENRIDLKRQDALSLLKKLALQGAENPVPDSAPFHFEWTNVWETAFDDNQRRLGAAQVLQPEDQQVLDQLRLNPEAYERYCDRALLNHVVCGAHAGNFSGNDTVNSGPRASLKQLRVVNKLSTRAQLLDYMAKCNLDESQLTMLMERQSQMEHVRASVGELGPGIIDQLKLDGQYIELVSVVRHKQAVMQDCDTSDSDGHLSLLPPQLLEWYFKQRLGLSIPQNLDEYVARIGLKSVDDFYRLIAGEYRYHEASS